MVPLTAVPMLILKAGALKEAKGLGMNANMRQVFVLKTRNTGVVYINFNSAGPSLDLQSPPPCPVCRRPPLATAVRY
jgi:hypothetical protein